MAKRLSCEENRRFWQMAIEMQHESGLSIAGFCRREGLQQATYYTWRRKLKEESDGNAEGRTEANTQQSGSSTQLVPVHVIDDHHGIVEVVSPGGYVVRVPQDAATENVRRVLQVLHEGR